MSVRMSAFPHETTRLPPNRFSLNLIFQHFFFRKSVEKIQISLKHDKNNGHFIGHRLYVCDIKLSSSSNEKCFAQTLKRNQADILCLITFFFNKNRTICETMWENIEEPDRPQMAVTHALCMLDK